MNVLRAVLLINAAIFILRASTAARQPREFYLRADTPRYALDAVYAVAIAFITIAVAQGGIALYGDWRAVQVIGVASMIFAGLFALLAATVPNDSETGLHRLRVGSVVENGIVALLYAILLLGHYQS